MKNQWQITIDELLTVFKTGKELAVAVSNELEDGDAVSEAVLSRIKNGKTTKVFYNLGQALLILHARLIPTKRPDGG